MQVPRILKKKDTSIKPNEKTPNKGHITDKEIRDNIKYDLLKNTAFFREPSFRYILLLCLIVSYIFSFAEYISTLFDNGLSVKGFLSVTIASLFGSIKLVFAGFFWLIPMALGISTFLYIADKHYWNVTGLTYNTNRPINSVFVRIFAGGTSLIVGIILFSIYGGVIVILDNIIEIIIYNSLIHY